MGRRADKGGRGDTVEEEGTRVEVFLVIHGWERGYTISREWYAASAKEETPMGDGVQRDSYPEGEMQAGSRWERGRLGEGPGGREGDAGRVQVGER
jgi:hypothetical protein